MLWTALAVWAVGATLGAFLLQDGGKDGGGFEDMFAGAAVGSIPAAIVLFAALFPALIWPIRRPRPS